MNWAPRFPRDLSAPAVSLMLVPALLGAAAPAAADPSPEGPSHAYVRPAEVQCEQGAGTLTVVGQLFPVLSRSAEGQPELSLTMAAELAAEDAAEDDEGDEGDEGDEAEGDEAEGTGEAGGDEATVDLELVLAPHAEPLPGVTAEEMGESADRAGTLAATLSGAEGRLLTGDDPPVLAWEDWEPPLGFYEVRVATESFSVPGFGDCAVTAAAPVASVQVGTDDEQEEQRGNGADEAAASGSSGWREHLPWIILAAGVLGAVCLLVPAVLHLRDRRTS